MRSHLYFLPLLPFACVEAYTTLPPFPWEYPPGASTTTFKFSTYYPPTIYLSTAVATVRDADGLTLQPPSTREFAETFAHDLEETFRFKGKVRVECVEGSIQGRNRAGVGIYLGIDGRAERYTYESGVRTTEGYEIEVREGSVSIMGAGARGVWWGTRTLLQELILARDAGGGEGVIELRVGKGVDSPSYPTRGFMLDAGRKWYSPHFLKELCTYASFFKFSEFHYHTSDNYPLNRGRNSTWQTIFSQFSLLPSQNSDLLPLVSRRNESLSRSDFVSLQSHCAARGITIVPEIESPGHALAITKWKPHLALSNKRDLLNLSHPDTLPTVKAIWAEFLPWFETKEVHIGADEYDPALADVYISFVNAMSEFIGATSGKRVRIWGTNEPSNTSVISRNVIIQHWQYGQSDPVQLVRGGYDIVNSEDWWSYTGLKNDHTPILPAPYPQYFNVSRVLNFGNVPGRQWDPSLYNPFNSTDEWQVPVGASRNRGAVMATWNDNGPDATTQLEAYYSVRDGMPVVGARAWSGRRGPKLDVTTLDAAKGVLTASAPGQNLDRKLRGKEKARAGELLVDWRRTGSPDGRIGKRTKGMNYTMRVDYSSTPWTLFAPTENILLTLTANNTLSFSADGFNYPLRHISETDGYDPGLPGRIWVNATSSTHEGVALPGSTNAVVIRTDKIGGSRVWTVEAGSGKETFRGRFEVFVFGGRNTLFSWSQMAFVAPLEGAGGGVEAVRVWEGLVGEGVVGDH